MNYSEWKIEVWDTPFADSKYLFMDSLSDGGAGLKLVLSDAEDAEYEMIFGGAPDHHQYPAYRNILEEYRLELWGHLEKTSQQCGCTFIVVNSPWYAQLLEREPLVDVHLLPLTHYVICTEDDVIEVLSEQPPSIIKHSGGAVAKQIDATEG